jgi:hypothetical protein
MEQGILRKIRALLKLGESDNPHEAASAVAMAARLMEKHAITSAALEFEKPEAEPAEEVQNFNEPFGGRSTWHYRLAVVLAKGNGCFIYGSGGALKITGRPSGAETVRYLFAYCTSEIDRITRANTRGEGRTYSNNYRLGMVDTIGKAIKAEREAVRGEMRREAHTSGGDSALVVVDNAIAVIDEQEKEADRYAHKSLRLSSGGSSSYRGNASARGAGQAAGAGVYPGGAGGRVGSGARQLGRG